MQDKQWLEKVTTAYQVYAQQVGPSLPVEQFVTWMYKQYGILEKPKKTDV